MFITGDTKEQVIAEFKKRYDQLTGEKAEKKAVTFDIYSDDRRASWVVGKKVGRNYIPLSKPFENVADARRYREENYDALVAELEKRKAIPNDGATSTSLGLARTCGPVPMLRRRCSATPLVSWCRVW